MEIHQKVIKTQIQLKQYLVHVQKLPILMEECLEVALHQDIGIVVSQVVPGQKMRVKETKPNNVMLI
jgi:hypothetical protein